MPALLKAQATMGAAKKGSANPFFRSKYASLNSVLEACKEALNSNGITILQPTVMQEGIYYVETILGHESGEWVSSQTMVVSAKPNDPQALGSAISYARRYGLQSLISLPAEDDDAESATDRSSGTETTKGASFEEAMKNKPEPNVVTPKKNSWKKPKPVETISDDAPVAATGSEDY